MSDFLLELLSEEIPARMQDKARADLARLFAAELEKAGLKAGGIVTYATPRRLALVARDLPGETEAVSEEVKGPRASAPPQALEGFLRKTGLAQEQLVERDGVLFALIEKPGRATSAVLAEAIPAIVRAFPWPKSMRWGEASLSTESLRWVRPLQGIVALFGDDVVDFEIAGIRSGAATLGHRFHHPGPITIGGAHDYVEKLRACHVIVDQEERKELIRQGAAKAAGYADVFPDEALVAENAGLTELPVPLLGKFDPAFLEVPPEIIQLTMRINQKYFACGKDGELWSHFVFVSNIESSDPSAIVAGNEKVLAARLADARFFWEQDVKVPLEQQAEKLSQIVFHEKLGTVADKVERVARLARWLVEEGIVKPSPLAGASGRPSPGRAEGSRGLSSPDAGRLAEGERGEGKAGEGQALTLPPGAAGRAPPSPARGEGLNLADLAERAARLAKADLVTGLVGEFPELQGVIGGHLARAQGEPPEVADAIRDHYKPVGQGDDVPTAPVTVAVSLADKLDTLVGFFTEDMPPTGSKDPFALRRAMLALVQIVVANGLRLRAKDLWFESRSQFIEQIRDKAVADLWPAILDNHERARDVAAELAAIEKGPVHHVAAIWREMEEQAGTLSLTEDQAKDLAAAYVARESQLLYGSSIPVYDELSRFLADRLKVQQREAGVRHDLIDAVFALGGEDDLVRLLARVKALQSFVETPEGADLLAGYKRAANILKKEGWPSTPSPISGEGRLVEGERGEGMVGEEQALTLPPGAAGRAPPSPARREGQKGNKSLSYTPENAEAALIAALDSAGPRAEAAVAAEDFEGAMAALASLRAPVDAFFDKVTVNDPDPDKRAARLDLLARMRDAVHRVADFSRIEG
ncbi:MAG: glycine--tRNA ligase subunit beta [Sphingomonas sp.]|nr:glycine--tRNA ligase subunit beta [Sphingomonas sp.]